MYDNADMARQIVDRSAGRDVPYVTYLTYGGSSA